MCATKPRRILEADCISMMLKKIDAVTHLVGTQIFIKFIKDGRVFLDVLLESNRQDYLIFLE